MTKKEKDIFKRLQEHYLESKQYFAKNNIVGIFLQGSQNYGLETEDSDIDTKLITTPTLNDLIYNRKPMSTTHFRINKEHIDFKDIRLMFDTFRKQNLNFIEILFTNYKIINPMTGYIIFIKRFRSDSIISNAFHYFIQCFFHVFSIFSYINVVLI